VSRFPHELFTHRLRLRRWSVADAPALRTAIDASDAHLRPWLPWMRHEPMSLEATRDRILRQVDEFDRGETFGWALWAVKRHDLGTTPAPRSWDHPASERRAPRATTMGPP
jgi:hypothetical protein